MTSPQRRAATTEGEETMESNARAVWTPELGWTDEGPRGVVSAEDGRITFTPESAIAEAATVIRWQYCQDGFVIDGNPYAEQDADMVRAWEGAHGDYCLVEVTRTRSGRWEITGGDSPRWTEAATRPNGQRRLYSAPGEALTAVLAAPWREANEADEANDDN
jgi:hypothetical protein